MSPPQVNLSEKKEKDPEAQGTVTEKSGDFDCLDINTVIVQETDRRAHHHRRGHHHHKSKRCICGSVVVIVMAVAAVIMIPLALKWRHKHHRHHEKFHCGHGSHEYRVDIDHDAHMIHAQRVPSNEMHIIHEYQRRMVAYKKGEHGTCYIDRLDESFEEGLIRWKSYKNTAKLGVKRFQVLSPKPIEVEVLEHFTDHHIFELCRNAKSVWVREIDIKEETVGKTIINF